MAKEGQTFNQYTGRPRTIFTSVEGERDYLKAQVNYLKSGIQI